MQLLPVMEGLHSAETFNPEFLEAFFRRARAVENRPLEFAEALRGRVIATIFAEPSTRTRLSFESAAHRLGASVITVSDPGTTSGTKGETLADMAKVVGGYCDLLVLRHPNDGASRLASLYAGVPVVNGGDGRLGHPTQTLVDLYTLYRKWGSFEGKTIGLMGDLRHGRTARSLAWALAMLGARILLLPGKGLDWEAGFERRILDRFDYRLRWRRHPLFSEWTGSIEARVLEPKGLVQKSLFREDPPEIDRVDCLYLTRMQAERGAEADVSGYPGVTMEHLSNPLLEECQLLHPLPRCEELPVAIDGDPRALYFEQAAMGPIVRQVVFLAMLGEDKWPLPPLAPLPAGNHQHELGLCPNGSCITRPEKIQVPWRVVGLSRRSFLCAFCDSLLPIDYTGCRSTRRVHPVHSQAALRISPENLRPFLHRDEATAAGYTWGG
jgi:aspartate carbamoyltransferase catalytic subunit